MEEFEGYKVPECTEEEVRKVLSSKECAPIRKESEACIGSSIDCHECLFDVAITGDNSRLQRYLDHRYPQKIAVHCKTQEEWDRVCERMERSRYKSAWELYRNDGDGCINVDEDGTFSPKKYYEEEGFKIISAQEYLGEEKGGHKPDASGYLMSTHNEIGGDWVKNNFQLRTDYSGTFGISRKWIVINTKEEDMNNVIAEVYKDKTYEEVVMVNKYFGDKVADNHFGKILLETHEAEVFDRAEELKKEEEEANKE